MLPDRLIQFVALSNLQGVTDRYASTKVVALLVGIGFFAILVDYARMLWRRRKMVRRHRQISMESSIN